MLCVDMDGVLADFVGGICKVHGVENPYKDPKNAGVWDIWTLLGMSVKEFWKPCEYDFWMNLEPTREFSAYSMAGIVITSPSQNHGCVEGKVAWLKKYMPCLKREDIIFASGKHHLARPGWQLIDDNDKNINAWREAGGQGILVPRPWNSLHILCDLEKQ